MTKKELLQSIYDTYIQSREYIKDHIDILADIKDYLWSKKLQYGICHHAERYGVYASMMFDRIARKYTKTDRRGRTTGIIGYWAACPSYLYSKEDILESMTTRIQILEKELSLTKDDKLLKTNVLWIKDK